MDEKYSFVTNLSETSEECINWPFSRDKDGYGWLNRLGQRRAHRVSFIVFKGALGVGDVVMHKCDNPSCVNPLHLVKGTQQKNIKDMFDKGRGSINNMDIDNRGERHAKAKLTDNQVLKIRESFDTKAENQKTLALAYGVSKQTISDICKRISWKHI